MGLFLASESPRRRELLKLLATEFEVGSANADELASSELLTPAEVAAFNAALKADAVSERRPGDWVLAADTVVELDGKIYGKPRDLAEAAAVLQEL